MSIDARPPPFVKALIDHLVSLPLAAFACPMGLLGLGLVWRTLSGNWPQLLPLAAAMSLIGVLVFAALLAALIYRVLWAREALRAELDHIVATNYLGALSISLLLCVETLRPVFPSLARPLFLIAVFVGLAIALRSIYLWTSRKFERPSITPAWLLPVVGNLVAPPIAAKLGFITIGWFILGFGVIGWLVLLPLILFRLYAGPELPGSSRLTLFIMVAPPGLASSAWLAMTSGSHLMAPIVFFASGMLVLLALIARAKLFLGLPFHMSWWSTTFPLHALTLSALALERQIETLAMSGLALVLAATTSLVTLSVTARTGWQIGRILGGKSPPAG